MAIDTVVRQQVKDGLLGDSISGGWGAILKTTGIDIREYPQVMDGSGAAVVQKDGREWIVNPWEGGGGFAVAHRQKTEIEIDADRQRELRRTFDASFSKDRLLMCLAISDRLVQLSEKLCPDHPPARSVRRSTQRKIRRLAQIQIELLANREADSSLYERELNQLKA
jgi:hypothetical protein